ncbi:MAG: helix-turn-helix domain-containing protein [Clostridiales bacterium]|nr:helix-turn-helix domain-containing protein [Clostridiales bacterium]
MFSVYNLVEFGNELRLIRSMNGLTQTKVREITGINEDTLRKIENGLVIPKYETLELLTYIYKTDLLQMLKSYRNNKYLSDIYAELDTIITLNNTLLIPHLYECLKKMQRNNTKLSLVNPNELLQLNSFLRCVVHYLDNKFTLHNDLINELTETLCLSITGFSLSNIKQ